MGLSCSDGIGYVRDIRAVRTLLVLLTDLARLLVTAADNGTFRSAARVSAVLGQ